jgi:hypothetical protein
MAPMGTIVVMSVHSHKHRQQGGDPCWRWKDLTLRELEALARSRLTVLFAFLHSRIACQKACFLQHGTQFRAVLHQSPRHAVPDSSSLAAHSTAVDVDDDVEFVHRVGSLQGLVHQHSVGFVEEVLFEGLIVDFYFSGSGSQEHTSCRRLPSARAVILK